MKRVIYTFVLFIFITSIGYSNFLDEPKGRILNENETLVAYHRALENSDVRTFMSYLLNNGYSHKYDYSIGVGLEDQEGFFINLGFDKGDPSLTTHIIYREKGDKVVVTFWEGIINEDGSITTTSEYRIRDGMRAEPAYEMTELTKVMGCIVAVCVGSLIDCIVAGPGWLKCAVIKCAAYGIGCVVAWLICWL